MIAFLQESALWALLLTAAAYQLGLFLRKKTGSALFNPLLVAVVLLIPCLLLFRIPNESYQAGMSGISWLLTPCTVCLGIPLYTQLNKLKRHLGAILAGILSGTAVSIALVFGLCKLLSLDSAMTVSLLPKSVTTAMAIPLAESGDGIVALTSSAVIVTGILGSVIGPALCKLLRLTDPIARGVAYGTASHVIGTTKASEESDLSGAVSSLSLVIAGITTAILFPFLI